MTKPTTDIDLMLLADGELTEEEVRELEQALEGDDAARRKLEAIAQVGEVVRTALEVETDQVAAQSARFARMWDDIERGIHAGAAQPDRAPAKVEVRKKPGVEDRAEQPVGWSEALRSWFGGWKGNLVSGLVAAAAVTLLVVTVRPFERVVEREVPIQVGVRDRDPVQVVPAALQSQPPEVEDLEVYEGSGMVLTMPGDGDDSATAVIWISSDDTEGPI